MSFELWVPRSSDLVLDAFNGGISVEDVTGKLDLHTINGGLTLDGVSGDVHGETTNGGVHADLAGDHWEGAGLDLRTTNGGVSITMPRGYSARLETSTVNGHLNVNFPITIQGSFGRHLSTQLGKGGALIRAETTNGGVTIRQE